MAWHRGPLWRESRQHDLCGLAPEGFGQSPFRGRANVCCDYVRFNSYTCVCAGQCATLWGREIAYECGWDCWKRGDEGRVSNSRGSEYECRVPR